ncbi:MAG: hypothetical protein AAFX79_01435 [Planctomycetota bacterium]
MALDWRVQLLCVLGTCVLAVLVGALLDNLLGGGSRFTLLVGFCGATAVAAGFVFGQDAPLPPPGACSGCGYPTEGLLRGVCPECGGAVAPPEDARRWTTRPKTRL